ncbi:acyl acyltransferase [Trichoderma arundinaceum]|uniref:Acyl acyltransferase n=1 Tax=Trichoderma arundinaceum TaxID=490622 RepID=A0A395NB76_TRIAR|nr:acyl acyltransferase [Trichoderma arundinaceum]
MAIEPGENPLTDALNPQNDTHIAHLDPIESKPEAPNGTTDRADPKPAPLVIQDGPRILDKLYGLGRAIDELTEELSSASVRLAPDVAEKEKDEPTETLHDVMPPITPIFYSTIPNEIFQPDYEREGVSDPADAPFALANWHQVTMYFELFSFSNNGPMDHGAAVAVERLMLLRSSLLPNLTEQVWVTHHAKYPMLLYTGAIARQRAGLVSTTKGAKVVNGIIISQLVTSVYYRMRGYATEFLKLLAQEMDGREDPDRIAFSVVYSGPNTDFFQKRG